jgi:hypothetical protein
MCVPRRGLASHHRRNDASAASCCLFLRPASPYICYMNRLSPSLKLAGKIALGVAVLSAATGAAFAAWVENSDEIFLSLVESGLSWCF